MKQAIAVNLYKEKFDVYCGRAGKGQDGYFGNPYRGDDAIKRFKRYFLLRVKSDKDFRTRVLSLKGKRLGCFCKPKPCHVDVIVEWINEHEK